MRPCLPSPHSVGGGGALSARRAFLFLMKSEVKVAASSVIQWPGTCPSLLEEGRHGDRPELSGMVARGAVISAVIRAADGASVWRSVGVCHCTVRHRGLGSIALTGYSPPVAVLLALLYPTYSPTSLMCHHPQMVPLFTVLMVTFSPSFHFFQG